MMKIYHNPRCSKSRESPQLLEEKNVDVEVVLYLKMPPTREELESIIQKLGISPSELIRKGEAIFKEKYKGKVLSDAAWIDAMTAHPKLIERPIFINGNQAIIGRPPSLVLTILK